MVLLFLVFIDRFFLILLCSFSFFFTTFAFFIKEVFKYCFLIFLIFFSIVIEKVITATTKRFSLLIFILVLLIPNILRLLLAFKVFFIHSRKFESKQLWTCLNLLRICLFWVHCLNNCLYNVFLCHINAFVGFEDLTFYLGIVYTQTIKLDLKLRKVGNGFRGKSYSQTSDFDCAHGHRVYHPLFIFALLFKYILQRLILINYNFQVGQHKVKLS